jgi:SRSO17 transposase
VTKDRQRRKKTGVPDEIQFQIKTQIALEQIHRARRRGIPRGIVLADVAYGVDTKPRTDRVDVVGRSSVAPYIPASHAFFRSRNVQRLDA